MPEIKQTKEQLEKRRDEINAQLGKVNETLQIELERGEEDQAIQLELESNLRKELEQIEDKLAEFDGDGA